VNCYLGRLGTPEADARYGRLIAEWTADGRRVPAWARPYAGSRAGPITLLDLSRAYWERRVRGQYEERHALTIRSAITALVAACGDLAADQVGPRVFRQWRDSMIVPPPAGRGWSRGYANSQAGRMIAMFRWGVAEEMVRPATLEALRAMEPIRAGRSAARETEAVQPVPWAAVDAILPHVGRQVRAMIEVQRSTGARACEVVRMRPGAIDRTGAVWIYRVPREETKARRKDRVIPLGPRAQRAVLPFLNRPDDRPLFSPAEAVAELRAVRSAARITPASCGNVRGSVRTARPSRPPGEAYTTDSYRAAIWRGCDRAFPPPADLAGPARAAWIKSHRWSPHQIRHAVADEIGRAFDTVTASKMLGHSDARITAEVYTTRDMAEIARVAQAMG
jgi:integrase